MHDACRHRRVKTSRPDARPTYGAQSSHYYFILHVTCRHNAASRYINELKRGGIVSSRSFAIRKCYRDDTLTNHVTGPKNRCFHVCYNFSKQSVSDFIQYVFLITLSNWLFYSYVFDILVKSIQAKFTHTWYAECTRIHARTLGISRNCKRG